MKRSALRTKDEQKADGSMPRQMRADAQESMRLLFKAALEVFSKSGVNAPVREIAEKAGVGLGTVYRHFPKRSDLIVAVLRNGVDNCAAAASVLAGKYEPGEALTRWIQLFMDLLASKRGLATALQSGDPAYSALPTYFCSRIEPALKALLDAAVDAKSIRPGVDANDLLRTISTLCRGPDEEEPAYARQMVGLLVDGLRYRGARNFRAPLFR